MKLIDPRQGGRAYPRACRAHPHLNPLPEGEDFSRREGERTREPSERGCAIVLPVRVNGRTAERPYIIALDIFVPRR